VLFDEVMDALRALDKEARKTGRVAGTHWVLDRTRKSPRSGTPNGGPGQLHS
jgi:hypothetical protein